MVFNKAACLKTICCIEGRQYGYCFISIRRIVSCSTKPKSEQPNLEIMFLLPLSHNKGLMYSYYLGKHNFVASCPDWFRSGQNFSISARNEWAYVPCSVCKWMEIACLILSFISPIKWKINYLKHGKISKITHFPSIPFFSPRLLCVFHKYVCLCLASSHTIHSVY
jgi:hypothetical protein